MEAEVQKIDDGAALPPVVFSVTDAAISELREKYSQVPDVTTKQGYLDAKTAIAELRETRVGVEKHRKDLKANALAWGKKVDDEAKRITAEIKALEDPIKEARKAQDEIKEAEKKAKEQEKFKKLEEVRLKISAFKDFIVNAHKLSIEDIEEAIDNLEGMLINEDEFGDSVAEASTERDRTVTRLAEIIGEREKSEREEARRKAEAEEREAQEAERKRVADIKERILQIQNWPTRFIGQRFPDLSIAASMLRETYGRLEGFDEFEEEARQALETSSEQMDTMYQDAVARHEMEEERAKLEAEREKLEAEKAEAERKEQERIEAEEAKKREAEEAERLEREAKEAEERRKAEEAADEQRQAAMHAEALEDLEHAHAAGHGLMATMLDCIKAGDIRHVKWEA